MQHTSKTVLLTAIFFFVCFSQNININGTVTDTGGAGIEGAIVQLEKYGCMDTTGANGDFTITGTVGINSELNKLLPDMISANIQNNSLSINLADKSSLEIITYNIQGKVISLAKKQLNPGIHSIKLPVTSSGVYFHKIKACKQELLLKSTLTGTTAFGTGTFIKKSPSMTAANSARSFDLINDVLKSTKSGYLNYRIKIANSDTSGIVIKMITSAGTLTDIDGNVYHTVKIGNQVWTVENLRTTRYNDGTAIPHVTDNSSWENLTTPGYCYYGNDSTANAVKYGALYNWYAVNTGKLAPAGWHVPGLAEWDTLKNYLIANGYNWDGTTTDNKIGKSMAEKTDWYLSSGQGNVGNGLSSNNSSGFSALPGGYRLNDGDVSNIGSNGHWWSATEYGAADACNRYLYYSNGNLSRSNYSKAFGFSVRLLRD